MHATRANRGAVCSWRGLGVDLPQFSFYECTLLCGPPRCMPHKSGKGDRKLSDDPTHACPKSSFLMFNAHIVL